MPKNQLIIELIGIAEYNNYIKQESGVDKMKKLNRLMKSECILSIL